MPTTLGELKRQVLLRIRTADGAVQLMAIQAVNDAMRIIAMVKDFDELMTINTGYETVAYQQDYSLDAIWVLTRLKTIYNIRYMDEENSRDLTYVPLLEMDNKIPYPETSGYGRPYWYTVRGRTIQLFRIPDEAKSVYITHSQWPEVVAEDADEISYLNIDLAIVSLATEMVKAMQESRPETLPFWVGRAKNVLGLTIADANRQPGRWFIAQPFCAAGYPVIGEYWKDPFVKENP